MAVVPSSANPFRAYVPRLVLSWLTEEPHIGAREIDGSMVFVDVAGFTALSERLAKRGRIGAEELTDALGHCFAGVLQVAYEHGGTLIKFGGDALLLFFEGDGHEPRACRAAVGMRRALRDVGRLETSAGRVSIRMSAGVHSGRFQFFLVGGSHRELIVTGPAATTTVTMENAASAGQIVVSPTTASALPPSLLGEPCGPGRLLRRSPYEMRSPVVIDEVAIPLLEYCLPAPIREQVASGVDDSEHRNVTVGFIHYEGTDELLEAEGLGAVAEALAELVSDIQGATDDLGVTFLGSDIDRDGGKVILVGGTPVAYGDDEERMLRAVVTIGEGSRRLPVRIGVNRGHVFAGHVGPHYRRTYTVMGDAVNLAARVMAKAEEGQVLATESVTGRARSRFALTPLPPFAVKGKTEPVAADIVERPARRLEDSALAETDSSPLIGRELELDAVTTALECAALAQGALVDVVGEPGIGKSRLMAEIHMMGTALQWKVVRVACDSYGASTPYRAVKALFRHLGVDSADGNAAAVGALVQTCRTCAPHLEPLLPLVGVALDLDMPETADTRNLDPEFRKPRFEAAAAELLFAALPSGTVLLLEDVHWMDDASSDLLTRIASMIRDRRWLICLSRRGVGAGFIPEDGDRVVRLALEPLSESAAVELLRAEELSSRFSPHDIAELLRRAGGNPLFLRELARSAEGAGGVDALPESLDQLLVAQIDRLPAADRRLLRYAAVLGTLVDSRLLEAALGSAYDATVLGRLGDFVGPAGDGLWRFRHALIRDASYEGLPYRTRREAHARVGEAVRRDSPRHEDDAELLSFHFF
ncbi:MAG: hypothetical protein QOF68_885, partial [Gaiellales bacterium]|nr:hypothetical protein [Gaiellales bacterium]